MPYHICSGLSLLSTFPLGRRHFARGIILFLFFGNLAMPSSETRRVAATNFFLGKGIKARFCGLPYPVVSLCVQELRCGLDNCLFPRIALIGTYGWPCCRCRQGGDEAGEGIGVDSNPMAGRAEGRGECLQRLYITAACTAVGVV